MTTAGCGLFGLSPSISSTEVSSVSMASTICSEIISGASVKSSVSVVTIAATGANVVVGIVVLLVVVVVVVVVGAFVGAGVGAGLDTVALWGLFLNWGGCALECEQEFLTYTHLLLGL